METAIPTYQPDEAGIYIHVPFCRKACHYCNFHFSTNQSAVTDLIKAIEGELVHRQTTLLGKKITTIYLGGGTPSILSIDLLKSLLKTVKQHYQVDQHVEITLEANPEDITHDTLMSWMEQGINRLSIGVQSFDDEELKWMNRAHDARQSILCLDMLESIPALDYSIDLIFGSPISSLEHWQEQLERASQYRLPHLSCYNLTVEPKTALAHHQAQGLPSVTSSAVQAEMFLTAHHSLTQRGYQHYEISNYSKGTNYSKHNTGYWFGKPYLGVGPSAHSYDGARTRSWNVAHNAKYLDLATQQRFEPELEVLRTIDQHNELIMTRLRTQWGLDLQNLPITIRQSYEPLIGTLLDRKLATISSDEHLILTTEGMLLSDQIALELFIEENL